MGARAEIAFTPRLLGAAEAAAYLGVSASTLRNLPIPRRVLGGRKLFDRLDLDRYASDLPYDGQPEDTDEVEECDRHFGLKR